MGPETSVTKWLDQLQAGDRTAAQHLWERYYWRLVGLARKKLQHFPRRAFDEEDVALSAFVSFCRGAEQGRFPDLNDRDDLWRLLVTLTERNALHKLRDELRPKRGGGKVRGDSAFIGSDGSDAPAGMDAFVDGEPTPAFAAEVADECRRLLDKLADAELRSIAVWKMEGYSNEEIRKKAGCALRSVGRQLKVIRAIWIEEPTP